LYATSLVSDDDVVFVGRRWSLSSWSEAVVEPAEKEAAWMRIAGALQTIRDATPIINRTKRLPLAIRLVVLLVFGPARRG
jgi:hypothetical protein